MRAINIAIAGTKADANKIKAKWATRHDYPKVTIRKKKTDAHLKKTLPGRYGSYYYEITAWG